MYIPKAFHEERGEVLREFMRRYNFATLVTFGGGEMMATHLPVVVDDQPGPHGRLRAHVSRANPQWSSFSADVPALFIFSGPHHYISPSWYPAKAEHGRVVPTWNYAVVHAYGTLRAVEDPAELKSIVSDLTAIHEAGFAEPWKLTDAPANFMEGMIHGIVGLEMVIDRLEGKWKFGQNRGEDDRMGAVRGLRSLGSEASREVAELMELTCRTHTRAD